MTHCKLCKRTIGQYGFLQVSTYCGELCFACSMWLPALEGHRTMNDEIVTTQDMLAELVDWWEVARDDDIPAPDYYEIYALFQGADVSVLRQTLINATNPMYRAAAAAALGALDGVDALPELVQARYDTDEDVRNFAHWAVYMLDEWSGCHDLWDFLIAAARIAMSMPRQLRLF